MNRSIFFILIIGFCFSSCQSDSTNTANSAATAAAAADIASKSLSMPANRLLKEKGADEATTKIIHKIGPMSGSSMLGSVDYSNGQLTLKYFESASAFNAANGDSRLPLDKETFSKYWSAGARSEKVLSSVSAEMLHSFDFINSVKTTLSTGEKNITTDVSREKLSQLTGMTWEEMNKDWTSAYTNTIVRNPEGRTKYLKELAQ